MNELSHRLQLALDFLKKNGFAKTDREIAERLGVQVTGLNMAKNGDRVPTWDLLLKLCDHYPINFWWLRSGDGSMIKEDKTIALLKRIEELEKKIAELGG